MDYTTVPFNYMNSKVDKAIRYLTGTCLVFFSLHTFSWANMPFAISLLVVSLYSLLFIRAKKE